MNYYGTLIWATVVNAATGAMRASITFDESGCDSPNDSVLSHGVLYEVGECGIEAARVDGTFLPGWQPNPVASGLSIIATHDRVYLGGSGGTDGVITALSTQSGKVLLHSTGPWTQVLAVDGARAYVLLAPASGVFTVAAADIQTGRVE